MVKRWIGDKTISASVRDRQIREISAEMVAKLILDSDLSPKDRYSVHISVRKIRDRSKDAVNDTYYIVAHIII